MAKNESTAGGSVVGFQVPMSVKKRKHKVDELLKAHPDIDEGVVLSFLSSLSEEDGEALGKDLDADKMSEVADRVREHAIREIIKGRVKEIVRKKVGGGGYVLYKPNQGKKQKPKVVSTHPTKIGAKRAELQMFPPKDPGKLKRLRKEVDRLAKDPEKRKDAEARAAKEKGTYKAKSESLDVLKGAVRALVMEGLFSEEKTGSEWDDQLARLSPKAVSGDKKLQGLTKKIEKQTGGMLDAAFSYVAKALRKIAKLKNFGVKKDEAKKKTYLGFSASIDDVEIAPVYIYIENGVPKIEVSGEAKAALMKVDPKRAKDFRAELVTIQERVLDDMDELTNAIDARDKYLEKVEEKLDEYLSGMSPLQISMVKNLLVKKYRKLS